MAEATKSPHQHSGSIYTEPAGTSPAGATCLCPVGADGLSHPRGIMGVNHPEDPRGLAL
jgi:hypothetical protein